MNPSVASIETVAVISYLKTKCSVHVYFKDIVLKEKKPVLDHAVAGQYVLE